VLAREWNASDSITNIKGHRLQNDTVYAVHGDDSWGGTWEGKHLTERSDVCLLRLDFSD